MTAIYGNKKIASGTLKSRAQVMIPRKIREDLNLHESDQLEFTVEDGKIIIQPVITIPKDQGWFWSSEWQREEQKALKHFNHFSFSFLLRQL